MTSIIESIEVPAFQPVTTTASMLGTLAEARSES